MEAQARYRVQETRLLSPKRKEWAKQPIWFRMGGANSTPAEASKSLHDDVSPETKDH